MYSKLELYFIFLLSFLLHTSYAQDNYIIDVQQFGLEEGLAHRNVMDVFKDSHGFLWIATNADLQRYDGYEFKTFPLSEQKGKYNVFSEIGETDDGWLYIFVEEAVSRHETLVFLHPLTGEFLTPIEKLGEDFSKELDGFLNSGKHFTRSYYGNDGNQICMASWDEITTFHFEKGIQRFKLPDTNPNIIFKKEEGVIELELMDSKGNYWLSTNRPYQILKFNPKENTLELIAQSNYNISRGVNEWEGEVYIYEILGRGSPEDYRASLSKYDSLGRMNKLFEIPKELKVHKFLDGMLWCIGETGWKIFDTSGTLLFELQKEDYDIELFGNMGYKSIISDELGKYYLNSEFGFNIIEAKKSPFTQYFSETEDKTLPIKNAARGIHVHNDSIVVNFENNGLVLLNKKNPEKYEIISTSSSAYAILRDHKGYYRVNNKAHYLQSKWSPDLKEEVKINDTTEFINQFNSSWSIWEDENNCIWSSYVRDLKCICEGDSTQESIAYKDVGFDFQQLGIYHFLKTGNNQVWLSSEEGLYLFDIENKKVLQRYYSQGEGEYYLPASDIFHMYIDEDENRWLGTRSGLVFWNTTTNKKRLFNRNDGLSNEVIYAVYEDDHNRLWLSSDYGIMSFDKETFDIQTYLPKDGLAQEEFNRISHFKAADGTIYFGGLNGVTSFHPNDFIKKGSIHSKVLLSECTIFDGGKGEEVSRIEKIIETKILNFNPNDRYFKLKFTLPTFEDVHKTLYAWRIDGVFDEWNYQKENSLQFGGLPYGDHTLHVKGQSTIGGWSPHELQIEICVLKPFYLQAWFIILSAIAILGSIFFFFRNRTQRLIATQKLLEEEVTKATAQIQEQAEELKQLDKVKSRFFANVSHELRTPLTLILGPIGSALKSGKLDERNAHLMKKASRSGRELLKLVGSILDLSKMDSGKIELYEQPEFLFPLMDRMVLSFESHAQSKGINFLLDYQADRELQIEIDKNKLEVILNNLLSNAVKFTPDKGAIVTTIEDKNRTILIKVADTGRGIHPKDQANVFDRFYQSQLADAPTEGGTGIGLALTQEFVEMMAGKIWLESDFGAGTTFFVELPKKETDVLVMSEKHNDYTYAAKPNKSEKSTKTKLVNKRENRKNLPTIIVTEDNYSLRDYIVTILSPYYNVLAAENGLKTLKYLEEGRDCQLIMSDVMMPEMDGFQLLKELKSNDNYRNIPVIMLTARADIKDKLKALRIGVDDYLLKPFEEEELLARIENLLHNYQERITFQAETQSDEKESDTPSISKEDLEWLEKLENHLDEYISDSSYSIVKLAYDMTLSERQLRRRIKSLTGLTPAKYLKEIRLGKARQLLEDKKYKTVAQTANAVGFQDAGAFSRNFIQIYGKNPSEYLVD